VHSSDAGRTEKVQTRRRETKTYRTDDDVGNIDAASVDCTGSLVKSQSRLYFEQVAMILPAAREVAGARAHRRGREETSTLSPTFLPHPATPNATPRLDRLQVARACRFENSGKARAHR
jgi:hypothetical protein